MTVDVGPPPKMNKQKYVFFWKVRPGEVTEKNIDELIMMNELSGASVHDFTQTVADSCFKALLTNSANKERWGDVAQREMLEHYNKSVPAFIAMPH